MKLDGDDILPGDAVYDIVYGPGIVQRIDPTLGVFYVRYGQMAAGYWPSGIHDRTRRRTLYWHDPVIFLPSKNAQVWQLMQRSFRAMWAVLVGTPLIATLAADAAVTPQGPTDGP